MLGTSRPEPLAVEHLVVAALARDPRAAQRLYDAHSARLHRVATRWLGCREDARDAVQETFARAWELLPTLERPSEFSPWIHGIARNVCRETARRRRRNATLPAEAPLSFAAAPASTPDQHLAARQAAEVVEAVLSALPSSRRAAFELRTTESRAYGDIARDLGCSVAKAKVEVHRARRSIERALRAAVALGVVTLLSLMLVGARPQTLPEDEPPESAASTSPEARFDASDADSSAAMCTLPAVCEGPVRAPPPNEIPWSDEPVTKAIEAP